MTDQSKPAPLDRPEPRVCRLLARAQMDGAVREPGYVFTLAAGERGPHKAIVASNADGMAWRRASPQIPDELGWQMPEKFTPVMRDEPLFEEIEVD
jgi:hypothetical protein